MTTIQQIKSHINPLRVLKVDDWKKVALILTDTVTYDRFHIGNLVMMLLSRYESLTSQPLTKEMFVCQVEKPNKVGSFKLAIDEDSEYVNKLLNLYQAALKKIWFEGFEINTDDALIDTIVILGPVEIHFQKLLTGKSRVCIWAKGELLLKDGTPTVSDLIYHISKFNETASKPVEINVTDSFIQELIK